MRLIKKITVGFSVVMTIIIASLIFIHKDVGKRSYYVSSEKCRECHQRFYYGWKNNTLHPYQFRPVRKPEDILGDFSSKDPALTFDREDVEYVVGNKWEQVYVRKIDGEYYPLPAKWYIAKRKWVPYKVKDWKDTPMSRKCNGCHTTGFNPETFEFNEFGIGCEACHGPGSLHLKNQYKVKLKRCSVCHGFSSKKQIDIITSVNSSVCGQCHNRGTSTFQEGAQKSKFKFPVNYTPGDNINTVFKQMSLEEDRKKKFWWGNGLSKNRHQEFADWGKSKHSKALVFMKQKHSEKERGKMNDKCLKCHSTDYRFAKADNKPDLDSAKFGVTCISCHDPHGLDKVQTFKRDGTYICGGCHIDSMSIKTFQKGRSHYPCPPGKVTCADCHMPYIVKTGGGFTIRSHAFKIVTPLETQKFKIPNSCQNGNCHTNRSLSWAIREFNKYYLQKKNKKDHV
ncbi:MAG: multiheme c-type cytochrome [Nitrospirota bacterium]